MKTPIKTLATIMLAATAAKATEQTILISVAEIKAFEDERKLMGVQERLVSLGILIPSNKKRLFVLNEAKLSQLSDADTISLVSDLVTFVTDGRVDVDERDWDEMTPSTQDYGRKR